MYFRTTSLDDTTTWKAFVNNKRSNHNTVMTDVIVICFNCYHIGGQIANFLPLGIDNRSRINGIGLPSKPKPGIRLVKNSS